MSRSSEMFPRPRDPAKRKHKKELLISGLPDDSHAQYKAACARIGRTMKDVTVLFMWAFAKSTPVDVKQTIDTIAKRLVNQMKYKKAGKKASLILKEESDGTFSFNPED